MSKSTLNKITLLNKNKGITKVYEELKALQIEKDRVVTIKLSKRRGVYIVWYKSQ